MPIALRLSQWHTIRETRGETTLGHVRITIQSYYCTIDDQDTKREILGFHWHPGPQQKVQRPHLHVEHIVGARDKMIGVHIPAERVALEDVLWMLISQLNVTPREDDWSKILREEYSDFTAARSWPSSRRGLS
jgi:hypothetical protein